MKIRIELIQPPGFFRRVKESLRLLRSAHPSQLAVGDILPVVSGVTAGCWLVGSKQVRSHYVYIHINQHCINIAYIYLCMHARIHSLLYRTYVCTSTSFHMDVWPFLTTARPQDIHWHLHDEIYETAWPWSHGEHPLRHTEGWLFFQSRKHKIQWCSWELIILRYFDPSKNWIQQAFYAASMILKDLHPSAGTVRRLWVGSTSIPDQRVVKLNQVSIPENKKTVHTCIYIYTRICSKRSCIHLHNMES